MSQRTCSKILTVVRGLERSGFVCTIPIGSPFAHSSMRTVRIKLPWDPRSFGFSADYFPTAYQSCRKT
ncbi:hypothetical protein M378DRAFT_169736 [Amanita muscaria Koide BX008]|uniref:Uncharacterized protein n=1 Tax=Amanita muscaria (strain Koide BX008) TaxID=946122 RepID=A0A0C2S8J9_AMAMK|nr:hypothetical protein M378DRAFT_169736 [Amanita muscaria Koide BX008]